MFWRFLTASTISNAGAGVSAVAVPLVAVTILHASTFEVSLITAAGYGAWLLIGLPAGVLVGRFPLRSTQVAMDLLRAVALVSVPLAAWADALTLVHLVVVALTVSLASVVFDVGNSTFLASIVSRDELTDRNSLMSASYSVTQVGGPSLGGLLVQFFGAATSIVVDVVSYLISAVLLMGLPRPSPVTPNSAITIREQIRDGWRFSVSHPVIGPCMALVTAINFIDGARIALAPVFLVRTLGVPAGLVGLLLATEGLGSVIGASLTPRLVRRFGSARTLVLAVQASVPSLLLLPLAAPGNRVALFALGNGGFAAAVVVISVITRTNRQMVTPHELLPRVMATVRFVSWGIIPFGAVAGGAAGSTLGVRTGLGFGALVAAIAGLVLLRSPMAHMRDLTEATPQAHGPAL